ncbi:MAG: hypothetical protein ABI345_14545 [Jatrophihabitans sp.]
MNDHQIEDLFRSWAAAERHNAPVPTLDLRESLTVPRRRPMHLIAIASVVLVVVSAAAVIAVLRGTGHSGSDLPAVTGRTSDGEHHTSVQVPRSTLPAAPNLMPTPTATITANAPSPHRLIPADYTGTGTAHGCAPLKSGTVVTIILQPDGSMPGCVIVRANEQLRVINNMIAVLNGKARAARITLPGRHAITIAVGQALIDTRPFGDYLARGQHFVRFESGDIAFDLWLK